MNYAGNAENKYYGVPVVIDTNIFIPSILTETHIANFLLSGDLILVWNTFIKNEYIEILFRLAPHYSIKTMDLMSVVSLINILCQEGIKVPDMPDNWKPVSKDRKDDPFLFAADRNAEYLITNDKRHLLSLKKYNDVLIGTAKEFFQWVQKAHPRTQKA